MKSNPMSFAGAMLFALLCNYAQAQTFGVSASAVWISDCNQSNFFNTSGNTANQIGPDANAFENANLGVHTQNSGTLVLRGAQVKTFKDPAIANVCTVRMFYRVYAQSGVPGPYQSIDLPFLEDCTIADSQFPSGGPCLAGDQKWQHVIADGETTPYAPVNLTSYTPGNYVLEVYYEAAGSFTTTSLCNDLVTVNNGDANYKAFFSVQSPNLSSTNPSSCFGNQGSVTIGGLVPGASYLLSYTDDSTPVGPAAFTANSNGQVIITGLNAGLYSNFTVEINGCTTNLFTGVILSDPIFVPTFSPIPPLCAGATAPVLPTVSNNGITGTWSPAVVDNQHSGTYTFTPASGQCGLTVSINVNIVPRATPVFSFGTGLVICGSGTVPTLPTISTNGIRGVWSPSVVDNQNSGTYTFTPNANQCATGTTFAVTVNPLITPVFSFGTSLTACAGASVPALPTTSVNGIAGTWSPSTIDNQTSDVYTFTPTAGQCATAATYAVTIEQNSTPAFNFGTSLSTCAGGTVPVLPATSVNGITGTWSPSLVDDQNSGTYTFTPAAGQCATTASFTVTVEPNAVPVFSSGTGLTICAGGSVPVLPAMSTNSITGTWNPAVIDNQNSGTYTFTPDAGQCATTASFSVTVDPNIVPAFSFGTSTTICAGATVPSLPSTSSNGITGTWSPAVIDNQTGGNYTFTPGAGQCATTTSFTVTVDPNVVPAFSFGASLTICAGETVPALPTTSTNGITGTWSPAVVDNQTGGNYTFTPTAGLCALPLVYTVTVNPNSMPTFSFGTGLSICAGGSVPALPATSTNGITGTWNPSIVDNQNTGVYTFTPTAGLCALPLVYTVTVTPNNTPVFGFGTSATVCAGATAPSLPATSANGITGTWNPSVVDNQNPGTYIFTPGVGQCATTASFTVAVDPNIIPVFSFGTSLSTCAGGTVPSLPTTATNGITGTWSPAVVDNQHSGAYTFTPATGLCATTTSFTVNVDPNIVPAFAFGTGLTICAGATVPSLPATSANGITGTWSPSVVDNQNPGTYIFTPSAGQCATTATFAVTVNPNITPVFDVGTSLSICAGGSVPTLPATSANGITGTWNPAVVDNQQSGTYLFTPDAGQCVAPGTISFTVTVTSNIIPVFDFGPVLSVCSGGTVPALPTTSINGIAGTWNPAVVSNQANGVYIFTPAAGQCVTTFTFTVTVNSIITPLFSFGTSQSVCIGSTVPVLPALSTNGITGTWSPALVDNQTNDTYTFTPAAGQCATTASFTLEVNPVPSVSIRADTTVYDGAVLPAYNFIASPDAMLNWTNSNSSIGLSASGTGNIPSFTAINRGDDTVMATIRVTPAINGCSGPAEQYIIKVLPLNKDVFVPNVFSPNHDGKNDLLLVYGNYIDKVDMRIFNQWGQQIATISNRTQGWDGTYKGSPQPVGVYVYVLKVQLADGRIVNLKGSITLVR